ncbi:hypothetical protein CYMTET_51159 [Cymbomonas tetramitiformis]|uniref:Thioredoxin domain-containing protein n=1 Tax=Cymbomonas tetramitiformis TaxID=36881 RepID=A0AAE0BN71_9CHLO|nr:hypothetical protein CYMTET_51159 [Cymbomonas tetramitiformis]
MVDKNEEDTAPEAEQEQTDLAEIIDPRQDAFVTHENVRRAILAAGSLSLSSALLRPAQAESLFAKFGNALNSSPGAMPTTRVEAFKRYIADQERRQSGKQVPEFPKGLPWFNTAPLRVGEELRGRVVVLDFWTYCCINCMHVLPELAALEEKYADSPVTVVGVHSAKFSNEREDQAVRNAVLRYDVRHPVVNDGEMAMWGALGVQSWPTLMVVGPTGRVIAELQGEGNQQNIDDFIAAALEFYGEQGALKDGPLPMALERDKDPLTASSPLLYPGKVASDVEGQRLFIADTSHNRIVVTTFSGEFLFEVGSGAAALQDGSFGTASFNSPQGLAYSRSTDTLYVADTENHALREVDLRQGVVRTRAGNGRKGNDYKGGATGLAQSLNSPWDGPGASARLQHPLGVLTHQDGRVFVADSYNHKIKVYDSGSVKTVIGNGAAGFSDGIGTLAQLSEPAGLALGLEGTLFVADTNNCVVRRLDLESGALSTLDMSTVPLPSATISPVRQQDRAPEAPAGASMVSTSRPVEGERVEMVFEVQLPDGYHFTPGANSRFEVESYPTSSIIIEQPTGSFKDDDTAGTARVQFSRAPNLPRGALVRANCKVYFCQDNDVCLFEQISFEVPLSEKSFAGQEQVLLGYTVPLKPSKNGGSLVF